MKYEYHPYADIWPMMSKDRYDELALHIAANGLLEPITLYRGKILDGRNRDKACVEAGIEPRYVEADVKDDAQALEFVVGKNQMRRDLSHEERAFSAARIVQAKETLSKGGDRRSENFKNAAAHLKSQTEELRIAASVTGTSYGSAVRALTVLKNAPEKEKEIVAKKASLTAVADSVRKPSAKTKAKLKLVSSKPQVEHPVAKLKTMTPEQVDPEFKGTMTEFKGQYGHVNLHTAEQLATMHFMEMSINFSAAIKSYTAPAKGVDLNWLRSPKLSDVTRLRAAVNNLDEIMKIVRPTLERAEDALTTTSVRSK